MEEIAEPKEMSYAESFKFYMGLISQQNARIEQSSARWEQQGKENAEVLAELKDLRLGSERADGRIADLETKTIETQNHFARSEERLALL